jgi:hypothetical protein
VPVPVTAPGATLTATPTLTVAGAYGANDFVGTSATAITFANAVGAAGGYATIISARLHDYALQSAAAELWLFNAAPTPPNDNAAWSISDADVLKCIGVIVFDTYYTSALNSIAEGRNLPKKIKAAAAATSIYGCLVTRGAPTYATGDVTVTLELEW